MDAHAASVTEGVGAFDGRSEMTNVVLVDDHRGLGPDLRATLTADPEFSVVGEAHSGEEAFVEVERVRPDVVIVGVRSADLAGMGIGAALVARFPKLRVMVVTGTEDHAALRALSAIGAHGVLAERPDPGVLLEAIRTVALGSGFVDPRITQSLARRSSPDCRA